MTASELEAIEPWNGRDPIVAWIDPGGVERRYLRRTSAEKLRFWLSGLLPPKMLHGGDWDRRLGSRAAHPTEALLEDLYRADGVPERTDLYARLLQAAQAGQPRRRRGTVLADEATIQAFFVDYVSLFERMRAEGYRRGVGKDEPGVAIARDGEIVKTANGNHRFAIARLLGLAPIPVEVHFIHPRWYQATPAGPDRMRRAVARAIAVSTEGASAGG